MNGIRVNAKKWRIQLHHKLFPSLEYSILSHGEGAKKDLFNK